MAEATFFDPYLSELQRQLQHSMTTGVADQKLKGQRLQEDANLMRPFMERRFGEQMGRKAEGVAGQGFHGNNSGIMSNQLGDLAEDQAFARGQFERQNARGLEDVERNIMTLTSQGVRQGAEGVLDGAANASDRAARSLPF